LATCESGNRSRKLRERITKPTGSKKTERLLLLLQIV
jgi:hypothetical protein